MTMPHAPLQSPYEREVVHALIQHNSPRIQLIEHETARSDIWRHFRRVLLDGNMQPYVRCNYCAGLIINRHGTSSLLRHNCQGIAQVKQLATESGATAECGETDEPNSVLHHQQLEDLALYVGHHAEQQQIQKGLPLNTEDYDGNSLHIASSNYHTPPYSRIKKEREASSSSSDGSAVESSPTLFLNRSKLAAQNTLCSNGNGVSLVSTNLIPRQIQNWHNSMSVQQKRYIVERQIAFAANDIVPMDIMERTGFRQLAQALINIGAEHGKVPVAEVLVSTSELVKVHLPAMCLPMQQHLIPIVLSNHIAITLDKWMAQCATNQQFLTISAHYMDTTFQLHSIVLGTQFMSNLPHIGEINGGAADASRISQSMLTSCTIDILKRYTGNAEEADRKLCTSILVTDDISSFQSSYGHMMHTCACSMLVKILDDVLAVDQQKDKLSSNKYSDYHEIVITTMQMMSLLQRCEPNLNLKQPPRLVQSSSWMSAYNVLFNLLENYYEIQRFIDEEQKDSGGIEKQLQLTMHLSHSTLSSIITFMRLFKECLESLCVDSLYPTINLCILWKLKLENHCSINDDDSNQEANKILKNVKIAILSRLQLEFTFGWRHHVALLLDPNFKSLKMLTKADRVVTLEHTRRVMRELDAEEASENKIKQDIDLEAAAIDFPVSSKNQRDEEDIQQPSIKRSRILMNFTEFLDTKTERCKDKIEAELQRYINNVMGDEAVTDILDFWRTSGKDYPLLQRIVRRILAVPACSSLELYPCASSGYLLAERRSRLSEQVDEILLLHKKL